MAEKRKILIDCDPGTDDAHAIMMALASEDIELVAITTVFGNINAQQTTVNALRVLRMCGRTEIPVYPGSNVSMLGKGSPESGFHGEEGLGNVVASEPKGQLPTPKEEHAANAILQLANQFKGELIVVAVGPLTNVALALHLDPNLKEKVPHLIIMGGNTTGRGNVTASAEFNFHCDPEAAAFVLENFGGKITLFPLELCQHYAPTVEFYHRMVAVGTSRAKFLGEMFSVTKIEEPTLTVPRFMMYDQAALAYAISSKAALETTSVYAFMELFGHQTRGQMVTDWNRRSGKNANVEIVTKLNMDIVESLMLAAVM